MTTVILAGRDAPLWLSALALHAALSPSGVTVEVIELPSQTRAQDVHATLPALEAFHVLLGLEEAALLKAVRGTFTLGQNLLGFSGGPAFFHPYGSFGAPIRNQAFFPHWLKARRHGLNVALEDFSLTAAAAKHGRIVVPDAQTGAFARTDYGYHLPAQAYGRLLKSQAQARGIAIHHARDLTVNRDEAGIASLILDSGRLLAGDLYLDLTGADALLIGGGQGAGRAMSWRARFPFDRVLVSAAPRFASIPAYAQIRAHREGWLGLFPTQAQTHLVQAFSSERLSDDEALKTAATFSGLLLKDAVVEPIHPGRRDTVWDDNCIALGASAAVFDPFGGVELQALQTGLVQLLSLFPVDGNYQAERSEYNGLMTQVYDRIADFQSAVYALKRCAGSRAWDAARQAELSPETSHKLETFRARGIVPLLEEETFPLESWQALFTGLSVIPDSYDPQVDTTPPEDLRFGLKSILAHIKTQVEDQTSHDAYLEIFCAPETA
ncbi:hypothetical protein ABAC460_18990 [Asticcacaulis sp. AC460]|uniref:tryptophan 7-halogenase n=1 Tax=Asticcacaulis sp. AC460 TaxID=1282360 RepID=UPI0003C40581|nr:tryptophan 7-halogenase [Asticcacaulis sp. AC460]ESQ87414.1 hypothetical protein ABAC460_18990 [Asticcacaulis sp. AC460]